MGFGPAWRVQGSEIIPLGGVDTLRIPDTDEYATIERSANTLTIKSFTSGDAAMVLNSKGTSKIQGNSNNLIQWNDDPGLGFFGVAPIVQPAKPATPAADPASLKTAVDALILAMGNLGLIA